MASSVNSFTWHHLYPPRTQGNYFRCTWTKVLAVLDCVDKKWKTSTDFRASFGDYICAKVLGFLLPYICDWGFSKGGADLESILLQEEQWFLCREGRKLHLQVAPQNPPAPPDAPAQQLLPSSKSEMSSISSCVPSVADEISLFPQRLLNKLVSPVLVLFRGHKRVLLQSSVHVNWLMNIFLTSMTLMQIVSVIEW